MRRRSMTMKALEREKLDVVNKTRSNIFGWRGQFTPEFVAYLLDEASEGTGLVLDPFCGSGTVLQECGQGIVRPTALRSILRLTPCHGSLRSPDCRKMSGWPW